MTRPDLAQEWRERLDDFAQSEMTVQEWCDFNRLTVDRYYYWKRRLKALDAETALTPTWLKVQHDSKPPSPNSLGGITVRIAGAAIDVQSNFNAELLRAVVAALASPSC